MGTFSLFFSQTNETKEEKKDDAENEKDAVTEKNEQPAAAAPAPADATAAPVAAEPAASEAKAEEKPAENGDGTENAADTTTGTLDESKDGAENAGDADASSTPVTDSAKKAKKEKSKKRFLSFRSFSFSKKDKTKPKKEEAAAANTTNGECEKVPEEVSELCVCVCLSIFISVRAHITHNYRQAVKYYCSDCVNDYIMSIGCSIKYMYKYICTNTVNRIGYAVRTMHGVYTVNPNINSISNSLFIFTYFNAQQTHSIGLFYRSMYIVSLHKLVLQSSTFMYDRPYNTLEHPAPASVCTLWV